MTDKKRLLIDMQGPIFAIVTPFQDNGDIHFAALRSYLRFLEQNGVKNIVVNGTTGEFPSLTLQERVDILKYCREYFSGKITCNISSACLRDSLYLLRESKSYCDFVLVLPPFYYARPSKEGVITFFSEILANSSVPVFLYNFPRHTQFDITPEIITELLEYNGNLMGIKDSSSNIDVATSFKTVSPDFKVYCGKDSAALDVLIQGLDGSVSGGGNPVPELLVAVYTSFADRDQTSAQKAMENFSLWNIWRKQSGIDEIPLVKLILAQRIESFPVNVRAPLTVPSSSVANMALEHYNHLITPLITQSN